LASGPAYLAFEVFGDEGCVLAESIAGALDLDDLGVVEQAIEQGCGDDLVAEDVAPFAGAAVGGEDHGGERQSRPQNPSPLDREL
jgi:hypothetical protein